MFAVNNILSIIYSMFIDILRYCLIVSDNLAVQVIPIPVSSPGQIVYLFHNHLLFLKIHAIVFSKL